jgi:hypothetical protein
MSADSYDWIYMTPAIIVLFVNILFLVKIMWVSGRDRSSFHSLDHRSNWPPNSISPLPSTGRNVITAIALWPTNLVTSHARPILYFYKAKTRTTLSSHLLAKLGAYLFKRLPVNRVSEQYLAHFFDLHGSCLYHSIAVDVLYLKSFESNSIR